MGNIMNKMSAIFFLYRKTFKNRVKKAMKKPVTYIYLVLAVLYIVLIFRSFYTVFNNFEIDKASILTAILTVSAFVFIPANLISYCKRKGLLFRSSDIHFLFPSPISPKRILLYSHIKTILASFVLSTVMTIGGVLWFDMPVWKMLVYFLFSCVAENIMEASLMIMCYGNEKLNKKQMMTAQVLMYMLVGTFVILGLIAYIQEGASLTAAINYLHSPAIQLVPVLGWYIAFIHLLFMGPTAVNIVGSVLFFASSVILFIIAYCMKCTGEYYEDATKFAEDYEVAKEKGKRGEVAVVGWKKKYGKAAVTYKGTNAKAIFYRQLLEYKKNRFFIFGLYTLLCLVVGAGMAVMEYMGKFAEEDFAPFAILGVMAYLTFIFSSYAGKWAKELDKPYTYLIPDSSFHKLWYATLIEHIRALIDGCLLTLPIGIVMGMPILQMILVILIYVCIQACKLYSGVMVEAFLGNLLGAVGKQFARIFFEGIVIGVGVIGALAGTLIFSVEAGFLILIVISVLLTACMMIVAAINFQRMETVN